MKIPSLTHTQQLAFRGFVLVAFFSAALWSMWQERGVGASGGYSPTKLQPVAVTFKGTLRYVTQTEANAYNLSNHLFNCAFLLVVAAIAVGLLIRRSRERAGHEA